MGTQSFKERERERREQEILRAAAQLIRERGYNNVSMDDIAVEVGVSKPTLYQHFKSKDDMIASTMIQSMQSMRALMDELDADSPLAKLVEMLRHMLESYDNQDRFLAVMGETDIINMLNHHRMLYSSGIGWAMKSSP
ncbi:TetR/AcrR family transcriptional regulator [bacterium]|nr:TetR/AcrR family transcriptional regulator [bacterium]